MMSEADAIQLAQTGDEQAFSILYNLHRKRVLNQCNRILRNQDAAEDACQDVFLKVFLKIGTYRGDAKFSVWLFHLTRSICLTLLRDQQRDIPSAASMNLGRVATEQEDAVDPQQRLIDRIPSRTLNSERRAQLNQAFERLPEITKVAFNANVVHGHRAADVCRTTGIRHPQQVFFHRRRAQHRLRQAVGF